MKRTVPLLIAAIVGFVMIVSYFIPATEGWGEVAAIWFDLLAAIAFILGGGNLLKVQLEKINRGVPGWGYAAVTLIAFLVTLIVGLAKVGVRPAADQEFYGETFATLPLEAFPETQVASVEGELPEKATREELPASVRRQLSAGEGRLSFRGWMLPNQQADLLEYDDTLTWRCTVERLAEAARPPEGLRGLVAYYSNHSALSFLGPMSDEARERLLAMSDDSRWAAAVESLHERSRRTTHVPAGPLPEEVDAAELPEHITYDEATSELVALGPVSVAQRNRAARQFPIARPVSEDEQQALLSELESRGPALNADQQAAFDRALGGLWTVEQLQLAVAEAGRATPLEKSYCELLEEKLAGETDLAATRPAGEDVTLNEEQEALLSEFAADEEMSVGELVTALREAGDFSPGQEAALRQFFAQVPTIGERNRKLWYELRRAGPLSPDQRTFLLEPYQIEHRWHQAVGRLFLAAHVPKYEWSGEYSASGSAFGWIYEYLFKPLTATMFALLAFYVASAAFRAFRAKNTEAILLLGTAFIILLGRTFAGVWLTSWVPDTLSALRLDQMTFYIMSIFNTAGTRAIMIGIALGIASTSLKILLGIDRSWLGGDE